MDYLSKKIVAVLVLNSLDGLFEKVERLISEGYNILEVTLRTDCAFEAISLIKERFPTLKVGAGTILTSEHLNKSITSGADFGVSPGLNTDIVSEAQSKNFDFIPGIATASELDKAIGLGLGLVKVFPAKQCGGPGFIKALSGPYPNMLFMPTGGVTKETSMEYLNLPSVMCVGGSWMNEI